MSILEQITEMRNQGVPEEEAIKRLQDQGVSPKAIDDALNQSKIKDAVSNEEDYESPPLSPNLQRGIKTQEISDEGLYTPTQQEESPSQDYSQYQDDSAYAPSQGFDTNTIIEISEQVFSEKIQKIQKQVDEFSEFKALTETKIETLSDRVKRVESVLDKLQAAILEKIGSYGHNLESIKKEMSMMQDSFGKVINPLVNKAMEKPVRNLRKISVRKKVKKK